MAYSMKFGTLEVKVRPWPQASLRRNVTWTQDSAGFWHGCDRGAEADFHDARVTVFGTKAEMEAFADWIEENGRGSFEVTDFDGLTFAPIVDSSGGLEVTIVDLDRLRRVFASYVDVGVDEVTFTLRAVRPPLVNSPSASLASLRLQEQFEQDKSTTVMKSFYMDGGTVSADQRADSGRFAGKFLQTTSEAKAILRYLLGDGRTAAFAFPSLPGVEYPFGKARGGMPVNCRAKDVKVSRVSKDRWSFDIEFVEAGA